MILAYLLCSPILLLQPQPKPKSRAGEGPCAPRGTVTQPLPFTPRAAPHRAIISQPLPLSAACPRRRRRSWGPEPREVSEPSIEF